MTISMLNVVTQDRIALTEDIVNTIRACIGPVCLRCTHAVGRHHRGRCLGDCDCVLSVDDIAIDWWNRDEVARKVAAALSSE